MAWPRCRRCHAAPRHDRHVARLTHLRAARYALVALCLLLLAPLALVDVPPLLDYPNHLARAVVLAFPADPILSSIPDERGRNLLVAQFDWATTEPEWATGYAWDIVVRGHRSTPREA